jgi:hypothetical protein
MKITRTDSLPDMENTVQPVVETYLKEKQQQKTFNKGDIVDVATLNQKEPYANIEVDKEDLVGSSKQIISHAVSTNIHRECLAVIVELPSGDLIVDLFSYNSDNTQYPSIERLALELGVDTSTIHQIAGSEGNDVLLQFDGKRWKIIEHTDAKQKSKIIDSRDFIRPLLLSGLTLPLTLLLGLETTLPLVPTLVTGTLVAILLYLALLYLDLAVKRNHGLPGWIVGKAYLHEYRHMDQMLSEEDKETVVDVEHAEFKGIGTLAPREKFNDRREVLYNVVFIVKIPPIGEKAVRVPTPDKDWMNSTCKRTVYSIAPTVEEIGVKEISTVPIKLQDDEIVIDADRLECEKNIIERNIYEVIGDKYVKFVNSVLGGKTREEIFCT